MEQNYYLGLIQFMHSEMYRLIKAETKEEAEKKLKQWADINVQNKLHIIIITETL